LGLFNKQGFANVYYYSNLKLMITYSIIQKSQLEGAQRLDAEYYQPEYLESQNILKSWPSSFLSDICKVTDGNHSTISEQFADSGVRYLRGKDLNDFFISDSEPTFIPENIYTRLKRSHIFRDDVLISIVGTVGMVSIVAGSFDKLTGNCKIAILHPKNVNPWFLSVFLISRYGQDQVQRKVAGAVQTGIILKDLSNIVVPRIADALQNKIARLVKESYEQQLLSKHLYSNAENLLLEELGLKNFQVEDNLSFVVNFSEVQEAHRMDAEHFQPKYEKLIEKIKQKEARVLTEVVKNIDAKFDPYKKPDDNFKYVELANINSSIGIIDGYSEILGKEAPSRAKRLLRNGDVVVSSVEGSLEKVALVDTIQDGYLASTGFFQFRSEKMLPEVLLVLAKSIVIQWQLKKHCAGTILTAVPGESLKKMFVPPISKETQQKIAEMVRKSHEARKKSKELLEEAKRKVEEMIEKSV